MFTVDKDPQSVLDYGFDWSDWLDADTIDTSVWTADDGITIDSESETTTTTTVWLSGGTAGKTYRLVNKVVTTAGRTEERTLNVTLMNR